MCDDEHADDELMEQGFPALGSHPSRARDRGSVGGYPRLQPVRDASATAMAARTATAEPPWTPLPRVTQEPEASAATRNSAQEVRQREARDERQGL